MTMPRAHFQLIADVLYEAGIEIDDRNFGPDARSIWIGMADAFASELAKTNPRFDRARFLRACGVEDAS